MPSVFTKIVNGEIPCYKIAETSDYLAFLDVFPLVKGHVLVIPKREIDSIFDLEDVLYSGLFLFAKKDTTQSREVLKLKTCSVKEKCVEAVGGKLYI